MRRRIALVAWATLVITLTWMVVGGP